MTMLVLMKNIELKGKNKLADKWKNEVFVVVDQPDSDIPVFKIRLENGKLEKIVHRNLLLPLVSPLDKTKKSCVQNQDAEIKTMVEDDGYVDSDSVVSEIELQISVSNDCINSIVPDDEELSTV